MGDENKRQYDRHKVSLDVTFDNQGERVQATSRDISLGGMFIETARPLPYGTRFRIEVKLPALGAPAVIDATVRWAGAEGMGVQWGGLRAKETWAINQLVKR